jgi:hypothetical protein
MLLGFLLNGYMTKKNLYLPIPFLIIRNFYIVSDRLMIIITLWIGSEARPFVFGRIINIRGYMLILMKRLLKLSECQATCPFLLGNRCDFLYMNEHRASWMLTSLSVARKVFRSSKPLEQTHLAFMFNKTWQHKMPQINQALAKIKNSGELAKIVQRQLQSTHPL